MSMTGSTEMPNDWPPCFHSGRAFEAMNVALFLPFERNKEEQTAASGGTKRRLEIGEFSE